jgi:predicted MFS family arabinose efflux permease
LIGMAVIVGRLGGGWLLDRLWAPAVGFALFAASGAASWMLVAGPSSAATALAGIAGLGLAAGLEFDLMSFLAARYFGTRSYGALYGTLYAFFGLGSGVSPLIYGRAFDRTGSFAGVVDAGAIAMLLGGMALLGLGRYRFLATADPRGPHASGPIPPQPVVS